MGFPTVPIEPTGHPAIPYAKSVLDYIGRWLGGRFISADYLTQTIASETGSVVPAVVPVQPAPLMLAARVDDSGALPSRASFDGAPTCAECGMLMTPNGGCYKCENCGGTSGCS